MVTGPISRINGYQPEFINENLAVSFQVVLERILNFDKIDPRDSIHKSNLTKVWYWRSAVRQNATAHVHLEQRMRIWISIMDTTLYRSLYQTTNFIFHVYF